MLLSLFIILLLFLLTMQAEYQLDQPGKFKEFTHSNILDPLKQTKNH